MIAIYPGTFDPITNGHVDIIQRAAKLFDKVLVAVAASQRKEPALSLTDRLALTRKVCANMDNVEVSAYEGLLVDLAKEVNAGVVIRGIRAAGDLGYEFQLAGMNQQMLPQLETVFIAPSAEYSHISATIVREIASMGGDISAFVPEIVVKHYKNP